MRLSVLIPTRNRAELWRSGWLTRTLEAQTQPPDEALVAVDHPDDDTLAAVRSWRPPFQLRVLEVLAPRPHPNAASGIPDNCLFHAAAGPLILHIDDDIRIPLGLCEYVRHFLEHRPKSVLWPTLRFVDDTGHQVDPVRARDYRLELARRRHWPTVDGYSVNIPRTQQLRWGGIYATQLEHIRAIGGHDLELCRWHNTDTRLGNRLMLAGCDHFFTIDPELVAEHHGMTWYQQHKHNRTALRESQGPVQSRRQVNGGAAFWTSHYWDAAYREL